MSRLRALPVGAEGSAPLFSVARWVERLCTGSLRFILPLVVVRDQADARVCVEVTVYPENRASLVGGLGMINFSVLSDRTLSCT